MYMLTTSLGKGLFRIYKFSSIIWLIENDAKTLKND